MSEHRPERRRDHGARDSFDDASTALVNIMRKLYRGRIGPLAERVEVAHGLIQELRADLDEARREVSRLRNKTEGGS